MSHSSTIISAARKCCSKRPSNAAPNVWPRRGARRSRKCAAIRTSTVEDVLRAWWYPFGDLHLQEELSWRNYLCVVARLASAPDGNDWYQRYFGTVDRDFQRALAEALQLNEQGDLDAGFRYARSLFGEVLLHRCGKMGSECVPRGFRENDTNRLIGFVASGMRWLAHDVAAAAD